MKTVIYAVGILAELLAAPAMAGQPVTLSEHDRGQFVAALVDKESSSSVAVEFLALEHGFADLETGLKGVGARIQFTDARVGYVRASVPRNRLAAALALPGLQSATLPRPFRHQEFIPLEARSAAAVPTIRLPIPRVATEPLTETGPYFPLADVGIVDFWRQHPTADGRGISIGFVDAGFDLLHPAIQRVQTAGGELVAKVRDMAPLSVPEEDNGWVVFSQPQASSGGQLTFANAQWRVPTEGVYRGGIFAVKMAPGSNFDPETPSRAFVLSVGVLWNPATNQVWIDTDGDRDFRNNRPLRDYAVAQEIDWFGRKENGEDQRIPFGVKIDATRGAIWLSLRGSGHGTWTGSSASGNLLTGGLYNAPAPNSFLVDVRNDNGALLAILTAAARRDVDIVNYSGGMGRPMPEGDEDFARYVLTRAAAVYNKPLLFSGDAPPGTIGILDYWNANMSRRNAQLAPPHREAMNSAVMMAPEGTVNTLLAPSVILPAVSRYAPSIYRGADNRYYMTEGWAASPAPEGYGIGMNPSCTIAYASGVVASLLSAAQQNQVRYDNVRLLNALFVGAHAIAGFAAAEEGHGLIRVDGAWRQLNAMAKTDDPSNAVLTHFELSDAQGEVRGYAESFLATGQSVERSLWITRRGGSAQDRTYRLRLNTQSDGFKLAQSKLVLPRDRRVRIDFTVRPRASQHIAFVDLIDDKENVTMERIPLQTRAPDRTETLAPGVERYRSSIPSLRTQRRTLKIDPDVQAVRTSFDPMPQFVGEQQYAVRSDNSDHWWIRRDSRPWYHMLPPSGPDESTHPAISGLVDVFWENRGRREYESSYDPPAPVGPIEAALTLHYFAVSFDRSADGSVTLHNRLAEAKGRVEWLTGSQSQVSMTEAAPGFSSVETVVPESTAIAHVEVTRQQSQDGIVDIYIIDATGTPLGHAELRKSEAEITVVSPKPGMLEIVAWARERGVTARLNVQTAMLATQTSGVDFTTFPHDSRSVVQPSRDSTYVAFRLEPVGDDPEGYSSD